MTALDADSSINEEDVLTSYSAGTATEEGGTTLQIAETDTFSEADPLSSYEDVSTDNSTDVTPAGQDTTGDSSMGGSGELARAAFAAAGAQPNGGESSGGGTDTPSGTLPSTSTALNEVRNNLNPGGTPASSQATAGITFSLAWVEAARQSGFLKTIHGPNMANPASFDSMPLSTYSNVLSQGGSMSQQALFSFPMDINGKSFNVILAPVYVAVYGSGKGAASHKIAQYRIVAVAPGSMTPEQFADSKFFDADLVRNKYILAGIATFAASLVPGFTSVDSLIDEGPSWKAAVSLAADVGTVLTFGSSRFVVAAGVALQLPAIGFSGYNLTQSKNAIEFGGNLGDVLLRLLVLRNGVLHLKSIGATSLSTLNPASRAALRGTGLDDAAIDQYLETLGDVYVFRGTTEGFAGNAVLQKLGLSPTSIDPLVATTFAAEGASKGARPVVQFGQMTAFGNTLEMGNVRRVLEREVALPLPPLQFAEKAPYSISLDRARSILQGMGIEVPSNLTSFSAATQFLETAPRMSPEQIKTFLQRAGAL